jgi:fatty acid desaturase
METMERERRKQALRRRVRTRPWWSQHGELLRYLVAFVAYVGLGIFAAQVFANWIYGVVFLVATVWGVPALWRRLR